jgi:phospholipid/cholesterol/gamma-HCH transport system substrate-binding protein
VNPRSVASRARRLPDWGVGLLIVGLVAVGSYLAYTKSLPWSGGFEVSAVFSHAQSVQPDSPVRIAGVEVGRVTGVEHLPVNDENLELADTAANPEAGKEVPAEAAIVTMELEERALPIRSDAVFRLRPRLFLEGNYFIDLSPGSPGAEEVEDGHAFPIDRTWQSVNLDRVFTSLQGDVRRNLQIFLRELGNGLTKYEGDEGFRELYRTSPDANRYTSRFNQAFLGTHDGDLRGMLSGFNRVFRGLARDERALRGFVSNLRVFSGSFAAEDDALGRAVEQLPATLAAAEPAFDNLNASFPQLRAFAREALPGVRSSPAALRAATPFVAQLRRLMSERELRGLVGDLRPTVPHLARLAEANTDFFKQSRALSSCFNEVIIPWSHSTVEPVDPNGVYPHEPGGRTFEETAYGLAGINSENRSGDANGHYIRVMGGSGPNLVRVPPGDGLRDDVFALTPFPLLGAMPRINEMVRKPVYRPKEACERQEPPNLEAGASAPPAQETLPMSAFGIDALEGRGAEQLREYAGRINSLQQVSSLRAEGKEKEAEQTVAKAQRALARLGLVDVDLGARGEAGG